LHVSLHSTRRPPPPPHFPSTTLFRSQVISGPPAGAGEVPGPAQPGAGEPAFGQASPPAFGQPGQSSYGQAGSGQTSYGQAGSGRSEEHTSELQSPYDLVCRLLLEKKK